MLNGHSGAECSSFGNSAVCIKVSRRVTVIHPQSQGGHGPVESWEAVGVASVPEGSEVPLRELQGGGFGGKLITYVFGQGY